MPPELPLSLAGVPPQQWLAAPSPVYLTGEESLRLTLIANGSGFPVTVNGRALNPDNTLHPITLAAVTTSTRQPSTTTIGLAEGWLLDLRIAASFQPGPGQVWAMLELVRGANSSSPQVLATLCAGYVMQSTPMFWPGGINQVPLGGEAHLRSITGSVPAAGAEISEVVPSFARWDLLSIRATLTTSAAAANRDPALLLDDSTNVFFEAIVPAHQTASAAWRTTWAQGIQPLYPITNGPMLSALPVGVRLGPAYRIRTSTLNIQAADQWSAIQYLVREWMTGE